MGKSYISKVPIGPEVSKTNLGTGPGPCKKCGLGPGPGGPLIAGPDGHPGGNGWGWRVGRRVGRTTLVIQWFLVLVVQNWAVSKNVTQDGQIYHKAGISAKT